MHAQNIEFFLFWDTIRQAGSVAEPRQRRAGVGGGNLVPDFYESLIRLEITIPPQSGEVAEWLKAAVLFPVCSRTK
ncbi:MAG: hypothetical protein A2122_02635 [Candidatus Liptonbacteria bacterium GWB1_49_6]|uniref:Uncharacterized protein n=1 Tax=Candidatus Liptonbacteria bacterium GWB1_49_6 TaxID=1798644 RepID=A0A1G2C7F5_9BACT|nr:MAG: hypothetical protein A2122_02635 [Candidatus Liptonbacteria bacterium GWB1_49_6]